MTGRSQATILLLAAMVCLTVLALVGKLVLPPLPSWEVIGSTFTALGIGYLIPSPLLNKQQVEHVVKKLSERPPPPN